MKKTRFLALALAAVILFTITACSARTDWAYIKGNKKLIIGMTLFAPMNYKDVNGNLIGFETEFAKAVCQKLGVKAEFTEINWDSKTTELASKSIDCIWNGMTITADLKKNIDISIPYMENEQVLVTKAENVGKYTDAASLKNAVVVAEKGSAGETAAKNEAVFKQAKYTAVTSQANALMEVAGGTADAAVIDYVMTIGSIGAGTDYANLSVVPSLAFSPEQYGIGFRKNSPETLSKVNTAIQDVANDGTLKQIADKYKLGDLILVKPK